MCSILKSHYKTDVLTLQNPHGCDASVNHNLVVGVINVAALIASCVFFRFRAWTVDM